MVDLPETPENVVTAATPRSQISPGEVQGPYTMLASSLDKVSGVGEAFASKEAEEAGHGAVSRGPSGELQIAKAPIFGPASEEYARAARFEYLTQVTPQIQLGVEQARIDANGDPNVLKDKLNAFTNGMIKNTPDPLLRASVARTVTDASTGAIKSTMAQNDAQMRENNLRGSTLEITRLNDETNTLARQGLDTPEQRTALEAKQKDRDALIDNIARDPRNGYSAQRAEIEKQDAKDQDAGWEIVGNAEREFKTKKNALEAKRYLFNELWGPGAEKYHLNARQRDKFMTEGMRALEAVSAVDKDELKDFHAVVEKYTDQITKAPDTFDLSVLNGHIETAKQFGDYATVNHLEGLRDAVPYIKHMRELPPAEAAKELNTFNQGYLPPAQSKERMAVADAIAHGEAPHGGFGTDPTTGEPIRTGYGSIVSGQSFDPKEFAQMHPFAVRGRFTPYYYPPGSKHYGEFSTASGRGQETYTTYKQSVEDYGIVGMAPAAQDARVFAKADDMYSNSNPARRWPGATGNLETDVKQFGGDKAFWMRAVAPAINKEWTSVPGGEQPNDHTRTWAENAVARYTGEQPKPSEGEAAVELPEPVRPVRGQPVNQMSMATQRIMANFRASLQENAGKNAREAATDIEKRIMDGQVVPAQTLHDAVEMARLSGQNDLVRNLDQLYQARVYADGFHTDQEIAGLKNHIAEAQRTGGMDPIAGKLIDNTATMVTAQNKLRRDDPISAATAQGRTIPDININDPDQMTANWRYRQQTIDQMRATYGPSIPDQSSALSKPDQTAIGNLLGDKSTPIQQVSNILQSARTLNPDTFQGTFGTGAPADGIVRLAGSMDPQRMNAGMMALDAMRRNDPSAFKANSTLSGMSTKLDTWLGIKDVYPDPNDVVKRVNMIDDPLQKKELELATTAINKEIEKMSPTEAQNIFNPNRLIRMVTLGMTTPEVQQVQGQIPQTAALQADYVEYYRKMRENGVAKDRAVELATDHVQRDWSVSAVTGKIMKDAPDKVAAYSPINGSSDWMRQGAMDFAASKLGPQMLMGTLTGQVVNNWELEAIMPDKETQNEIARGDPHPGYTLIVMHNGAQENLGRVSWDREAAMRRADEQFKRERQAREPTDLRETFATPDALGQPSFEGFTLPGPAWKRHSGVPDMTGQPALEQPFPATPSGSSPAFSAPSGPARAVKKGLSIVGSAAAERQEPLKPGDIMTTLGTRG